MTKMLMFRLYLAKVASFYDMPKQKCKKGSSHRCSPIYLSLICL